MTRFQREVSGELGAFWEKHAKEEAAEAARKAAEGATVEEDGAIRWNSNGSYIPDDFCEKLEYEGFPFSRAATAAKREAQVAKELEAYRSAHRGLDAETLAEARAAFGEGTTICDVITGEKITL